MSYDACLCEVCGGECHTILADWVRGLHKSICEECHAKRELRESFLREMRAYYPYTRIAHRFDVYLTLGV